MVAIWPGAAYRALDVAAPALAIEDKGGLLHGGGRAALRLPTLAAPLASDVHALDGLAWYASSSNPPPDPLPWQERTTCMPVLPDGQERPT